MTQDDMTQDEWDGLLDVALDDALPESWQARLDAHLEANPEAARDAQTLRDAVALLRDTPAARPDDWFAERTLGRLLREHGEAQPPVRQAASGRTT